MVIEDVEPNIFRQLLEFAYTGTLDQQLSLSMLASLLRVAYKYNCADLAITTLRRLQHALHTERVLSTMQGEDLAQVIGVAEEIGNDGVALLQDAIEAILLHRPELLEDENFLVTLARVSPSALRAVLAVFRTCSRLDMFLAKI